MKNNEPIDFMAAMNEAKQAALRHNRLKNKAYEKFLANMYKNKEDKNGRKQ